MLVGLLIFSGCDGSSPEAGEDSCLASADSGVVIDSADSGETGDTAELAECALFGADVLPDLAEVGDEHAHDVTICPVWSGIRDATHTYAVNRGSGSGYQPAAVTTEFVVTQPVADRTGGFVEVTSRFIDGLHDDDPDAPNAALGQIERQWTCDHEGLWLNMETSHQLGFHSWDDGPANPLRSGWECTSQAALLLPTDSTVGTEWSAQCSGRRWSLGDVDAVDCTFTFTVDEEREVATPGGTWVARHVVPVSSAPVECLGLGDAINSYFTNADGYWVASGVGVIMKSTRDQGNFVRISPDY